MLSEFVPEEEILPVAQSIARVFARLGRSATAITRRIKFLVENLGIDEFRRLVFEERKILPEDSRWTSYLSDVPAFQETPTTWGVL